MAEGGAGQQQQRPDEAWVTLATNDSYALGAMVVAQSLRRVSTTRALVVMITADVSSSMRSVLQSLFDHIVVVNVLDSQDTVNLALLSRPDLGITFTKLHCWRLTQYGKCVFLDADTLIIQNCDELFEREEFSAAPDSGWPDCFNSGVFVFRPSLDTYQRLLAFALQTGSFDGGDQGLLNLFFKDWATSDISRHLPFIYNMIASAIYSYAPAYKQYGANVKIAHFIGAVKPWLQYFDSGVGRVSCPPGQEHQVELLQAWWEIFRGEIHQRLTPEMGFGVNEQSATVLEQVIELYSTSTNNSAHYQPAPPPPPYQAPPPPPHQGQGAAQQGPPPAPPLLVAIQRHTPEYIVQYFETQTQHFQPNYSPSSPSSSSWSPSFQNQPSPNKAPSLQAPSAPPPPSYAQVQPVAPPPPSNMVADPSQSTSLNHAPDCPDWDSEELSKGLAGAFSKMTFDGAKSSEQVEYEDEIRRVAWEQGNIDYMGKDSFDNILKKIQASMASTPADPVAAARGKSPSPPKTVAPVAAAPPAPAPQEPPPPAPVLEPAVVAAAPPPQAEAPPPPQPVAEAAPQVPPPVVQQEAQQAAPAPSAPEPAVVAPVPEAPPAAAAPAPPAGAHPAAPAQKSAEELQEEKLLAERQALEKKLAEQKRIAEQKLQEERAAAEAAAVAAAAAAAAAAAVPKQPEVPPPAPAAAAAAAPPAQQPPSPTKKQAPETPKPPEGAVPAAAPAGGATAAAPAAAGAKPKAPPRKQTSKDKDKNLNTQFGAAMVATATAAAVVAIGTAAIYLFGGLPFRR